VVCARELDVGFLDASVFAENARMAKLLQRTGLPLQSKTEDRIRTLSIVL